MRTAVRIRLHRNTITGLRLRRGIEAPRRRRRRIRKLRLLALLVVLLLLASGAFTLGLVRAVAGEIPALDPAHQSGDLDTKRLLGVLPGNGKALGLEEQWAYNVIRTVGNYGEIFERNVGAASALKLSRGLNALWSKGGLMYAIPYR